jgi:hypothetical protein
VISNNKRLKKLLFQMRYLREELDECQEIFENAKIGFNNAIRQLHHDMNVFDSAFDSPPSTPPEQDSVNIGCEDTIEDPKPSHPAWAKKLFRNVVKETHPDHFPKSIRESRKKRLTSIYDKTVSAYHKNSYSEIIDAAIDLGIDIEHISDDQILIIKRKIIDLQGDISSIKNSLYWQWAHADEEMKNSILKKFIDLRGWTKSEANRKKASTGSRKHPGKSISWARKKFKNVSDIPNHDEDKE